MTKQTEQWFSEKKLLRCEIPMVKIASNTSKARTFELVVSLLYARVHIPLAAWVHTSATNDHHLWISNRLTYGGHHSIRSRLTSRLYNHIHVFYIGVAMRSNINLLATLRYGSVNKTQLLWIQLIGRALTHSMCNAFLIPNQSSSNSYQCEISWVFLVKSPSGVFHNPFK